MRTRKLPRRPPKRKVIKPLGKAADLTMKEIEKVEKQDWQLWLLTIFMILILTTFIFISELFRESDISPYILGSTTLVFGFCIYIFSRNRSLRRKRKGLWVQKMKTEQNSGTFEKVKALFQVSQAVSSRKDLASILDLITRETLNCLQAHRCTIFLLDGKSGILKNHLTFMMKPADEQVGLFEEKEVARKAVRQKRPFLMREPQDFSEFFKYGERQRKITSLICIPFFLQERPIGAVSIVLINEDRSFSEKDLQFLSIFADQASLAMENTYLLDELRKGVSFRKSYEQYLDDILNQLQALSSEERHRIEEHIGRLMPETPAAAKQGAEEGEGNPPVNGSPASQAPAEPGQPEEAQAEIVQVEVREDSLGQTDDLSGPGIFVRTPNPMELGEEFMLKLNPSDGGGPIEVRCKVIWTNKYGKESKHLHRGMAVKFLNTQPKVQKRLEEYLQSRKNRELSFVEGTASAPDRA